MKPPPSIYKGAKSRKRDRVPFQGERAIAVTQIWAIVQHLRAHDHESKLELYITTSLNHL